MYVIHHSSVSHVLVVMFTWDIFDHFDGYVCFGCFVPVVLFQSVVLVLVHAWLKCPVFN